MNLGILGGTFNPIHNGHIQMAQYAIDNHDIDDVIILPSGHPPHKSNKTLLNSNDRYELCLLATMDHDNLVVESLEIERKGTTYTFDTLQYYNNLYNLRNNVNYIIGGDTVLQLHKWKKFEEIFKICKFIAFLRKGYNNKKIIDYANYLVDKYKLKIVFDYQEVLDVSSSDIRSKIINGVGITNLVPKRVEEYIYEHKIYK